MKNKDLQTPDVDFKIGNLQQAAGNDNLQYYVVFRIERQHYALPLKHVTRALRMVALTPFPEMPEWVMGIINMAGQTLPVLDLRFLFNQTKKDPELQDRILILQIKEQTAAVVVDDVLSVMKLLPEQIEPPSAALSKSLALAGTVRHDDALVIILDAYKLLPQAAEDNTGKETL